METSEQQYCLRWNNHVTNMVTVFGQLLDSGAFTDVTLAVDSGAVLKCHKMVLAACSSYFQELFIRNPCEHPVVILSEVKLKDIKAILHYMYCGEVNIAHDQLEGMIKVARFLKIKGLSESSDAAEEPRPSEHIPCSLPSLAAAAAAAAAIQNLAQSNGYLSPDTQQPMPSTSHNQSSGAFAQYGKSPVIDSTTMTLWPALSALHLPPRPLNGHSQSLRPPSLGGSYDNSAESSPLSRKKISSLLANRDTPILRNVLGGQNEPSPLDLDRPENFSTNSNSSSTHNERRRRTSEQREPASDNDESSRQHSPTSTGRYRSQPRTDGKPEWKRYKQYTRQHILDAMSAVRNKEMSALQAAGKFGIPSRTLYDKLKKASIIPNRGGNSRSLSREAAGSARFPYSGSMNGDVYGPSTSTIPNGDVYGPSTSTTPTPNGDVYAPSNSTNGDGYAESSQGGNGSNYGDADDYNNDNNDNDNNDNNDNDDNDSTTCPTESPPQLAPGHLGLYPSYDTSAVASHATRTPALNVAPVPSTSRAADEADKMDHDAVKIERPTNNGAAAQDLTLSACKTDENGVITPRTPVKDEDETSSDNT